MASPAEISGTRRAVAVLAALFLLAYLGGTPAAERVATAIHLAVACATGLAYAAVGSWPRSSSARTILGAGVAGILIAAIQLVQAAPASDYETGTVVAESIFTTLLFGGLAALIRRGVVRDEKT